MNTVTSTLGRAPCTTGGVLTDEALADVERSTWSRDGEDSLTPEILGRMVVWAALVHGTDTTVHGSGGNLFDVLARPTHIPPMPPSIRAIVHLESSVDGAHIEELTRLLAGAQSSCTIGHAAPDTAAPFYRVAPHVAAQTLASFEKFFPVEVQWLRTQFPA